MIKPYKISVPKSTLNNIYKKVRAYPWKMMQNVDGWEYGTNYNFLKKISKYWVSKYNWKKFENKINSFKNYKTNVDGINLHFIIEKSRNRVRNNPTLKLIDESAKWIKKTRSKDIFSLNYDSFSNDVSLSEIESKRYDSLSNYKTGLVFSSLSSDAIFLDQDSVLKLNRQRWHESLSNDIYMEEALNVLKDLIFTQNNVNASLFRQ